ncbi:hypothetical protein [Massilia sp. BJB1822]|uniref:hypothetical protein n=1 Tax=Massilia sp. BJB1822 TaxID=2744470 RepID=UPI001857B6E6|nr:hypothetical protein [Massilia sp. BJB1822]NVD98163.1 hypothetical protein [Massilia sp. BJB1822]
MFPLSRRSLAVLSAVVAASLAACSPRSAEAPAASAPASAPASMPAETAAPSAPQSAAPAQAKKLSKDQAIGVLMDLPELKAWSDKIEKNSKGQSHGALIEFDATPFEHKGKTYYQFSFVENTPEAVQRWENFLIAPDGEILIEDQISGELLSLARWRKEKQPLQRAP